MNLLINLIPIKRGGGQQVATNFVSQILNSSKIVPFFLVTENTSIHFQLQSLNATNYIAIKDSLKERYIFQKFKLGSTIKINNINIIYTMFGPGIFYKNIPSVTGCAYSNLFFPEIDFWSGYSFMQRIKLRLIDNYRLKNTLRSHAIVFENEAMRERAIQMFKYPSEKTIFIPPSITEYIDSSPDAAFRARLSKIDGLKYNILILSGWHKNKKIDQVPSILKSLFDIGYKDVRFIITVPPDHPESIILLEKAKELNVHNNILLFGSVKPDEVYSLFQQVNAVILLSLLESFSNNIIEAWYFKKPLFISNQEWARAICKNAAIYVDRDNAENIARHIINYRNDLNLQKEIANNSLHILKSYPSPSQKVAQQVDFLEKIYNAHKE